MNAETPERVSIAALARLIQSHLDAAAPPDAEALAQTIADEARALNRGWVWL